MPDDSPQSSPNLVNLEVEHPSDRARLPSASAPPLTATSTKTTPIADAVRGEIKQILEAEMLDLKMLADLVEVARTGRDLVAVRNPTARFDAKAQGLGNQNMMQGMGGGAIVGGGGFICSDEDMYDDDGVYGAYPQWKGQGPGIRGAKKRMEDDVRKVLEDSPLAKAAKTEILALTDANPFAASELLQIEQLAAHTLRLLAARLGISGPSSRGGNIRRNVSIGMNPGYGYGQSPYSSPETYGAKIGSELVSALAPKREEVDPEKLVLAIAQARTSGLPDLAAKLEMQLTGSPPAPAPAPTPATSAEPKLNAGGVLPSGGE